MRVSYLLSAGLSLLYFPGCKAASDSQGPARVVGSAEPGTSMMPYPDSNYLNDHGYLRSVRKSGITNFYSQRYKPDSVEPVLQLYYDADNKAIIFYDNHLYVERYGSEISFYAKDIRETTPSQIPDENTLRLSEISKAFCNEQGFEVDQLKWIIMDVLDAGTRSKIVSYREKHDLRPKDNIVITPDDLEFYTDLRSKYYWDAHDMVPGFEIDRIIISRQERLISGSAYPAIVAEMMAFSFQKKVPKDEKASSEPEEIVAQFFDEDSLNAALKVAEDVLETERKNSL
ncbi:hypothetical protein CFIMG_006507RA [Ceratocystis fimbriata CBS 114723]|uniref:Uncharacterized protein n=1 Tax=Ceratocystis fimbriata CBS 114723 TaxID=1035309 RepID=A0A2C5WU16_9PEZI|nr:hypothetical protein CFIMG_006507RA [Ceratocystis fimbriata CBS 114723]